jgi:glc operon protein GlcG
MLTFEQAERVLRSVLQCAADEGLDNDIAIAVTDAHGELMCFARRDNAAFHAGVLARNKAYTAARDRQATSSLGAWAKETGKDMGYWTDNKITGIAGGVPIVIKEHVVGGVGVSGLDEFEDERLALAGLTRVSF